MSQVSLKFLTDSILLDPSAQTNCYSSLSDQELLVQLMAYREHLKDRWNKLNSELIAGRGKLGAYFGSSLATEPKFDQLMRASLYFDQLLIKDPLIPHGRESAPYSEEITQLIGVEEGKLNRRAVAEAARLITRLLPLVRGGIVKLVPSSMEHEPPQEVRITYSPNLFAERIPAPLRPWFYNRAEVMPLRLRADGEWDPLMESDLALCSAILVRLRGFNQEECFFYLAIDKQRILPDGKFACQLKKPMSNQLPSLEEFQAWVRQSINQISGGGTPYH